MKIKMLCTLANKDDTRFAPVNDAGNTVSLRGLDLAPGKEPLPAFKVGDVYAIEITAVKQ